MSARGDKAKGYFLQGYNCTQSVVLAFMDKTGLTKEQSAKISSGFGGGMGRMREVCGAVSGMVMVLNLLYGYSKPKDFELKKTHYKKVQDVSNAFKEQNGSIVCRELLGLTKNENSSFVPTPRTNEYYKKRPCPDLIKDAADILDEYINSIEK